MDFYVHLCQKKKLITERQVKYLTRKEQYRKEKDFTPEDMVRFYLLDEKTTVMTYNEYVGQKIYGEVYPITEEVKDLYKYTPKELKREIIPVATLENKVWFASVSPNRENLIKRISMEYRDYDCELMFVLKPSFYEALAELNDEENVFQRDFTPGDRAVILCLDAIAEKATDIHIESIYNPIQKETEFPVRFRIATELVPWERTRLNREQNRAIVSALVSKTNSQWGDINHFSGLTSKIPDVFGDGTYSARIMASRVIDDGYHAVVRLHSNETTAMSLEQLGFKPNDVERLKTLARKESGHCMVTGHVGSGKNTTIYAMASYVLSSKAVKFMEFSSPVEVKLPCIQYDYLDDMERLLHLVKNAKKQDPDMTFVGEIPNKEVALAIMDLVHSNIAVWSTTHLDRAHFIPHKLEGFYGDDWREVLSQTSGVINQKIFRKLCPYCKEEYKFREMGPQELSVIKNYKIETKIYKPSLEGCEECRGGFQLGGLQPLVEILVFERELLGEILRKRTATEAEMYIRDYMKESRLGMEYSAKALLEDGVIDLAQVVRKEINHSIKE